MAETVLAIFAHPDDETLACGGTLAKHVAAGDRVAVAVATDGVGSRAGADAAPRRSNFLSAANVLGVIPIAGYEEQRDWEDQRLDREGVLSVAQWVERVVSRWQPAIVYTHHRGDLNRDHQIVAEAVLVATRPQPGMTVGRVYAGEVLSSTEWAFDGSFVPNVFVDITSQWDTKMAAMCCYVDELRQRPHARSAQGMESLASHRGLTVGVEFAEAFQLVREIR